MKTIYADFNDFDASGALPLTCAGSIDAMRKLATPLNDGEEVWLTDGELWVKARVFARDDSMYEARGDWVYFDFRPAGDE